MAVRRKKTLPAFRGILISVGVLVVVLCFFTAVSNLRGGHRQEDRKQLETALRRAAVTCYAAEGIYPPSLDYMIEHYGVQIDESRYAVHYDVFADNLMPDITVLEKEP